MGQQKTKFHSKELIRVIKRLELTLSENERRMAGGVNVDEEEKKVLSQVIEMVNTVIEPPVAGDVSEFVNGPGSGRTFKEQNDQEPVEKEKWDKEIEQQQEDEEMKYADDVNDDDYEDDDEEAASRLTGDKDGDEDRGTDEAKSEEPVMSEDSPYQYEVEHISPYLCIKNLNRHVG